MDRDFSLVRFSLKVKKHGRRYRRRMFLVAAIAIGKIIDESASRDPAMLQQRV